MIKLEVAGENVEGNGQKSEDESGNKKKEEWKKEKWFSLGRRFTSTEISHGSKCQLRTGEDKGTGSFSELTIIIPD